ncbi:hypothetical protein [Ottowia sp.]|uniref:hypothetical protein n=1 Tax=Ottowia sp. TaxID=1898956 RepID=UPI0039E3FAA7
MQYQSNKEAEAARKREQRIKDAVRDLPDEVVDGDEEIQRLKKQIEPLAEHAQRVRSLRRGLVLQNLRANITSQLQQARQAMKQAALDDALAGEFTFPRYMAIAQRIPDLEDQMEAARLAEQASEEPLPFVDTLGLLNIALWNTLQERKREYVEAHPELLEEHG